MRTLIGSAILMLSTSALLACSGVASDSPPADDTAAAVPGDEGDLDDPAMEQGRPVEQREAPSKAKRPAKKKPAKRPSPAAPPAPAPTPQPAEPEPPDEVGEGASKPVPKGIKQVSARSWTVTSRLVERWKADPYELANAEQVGEGWELRQVRRKEATHLGMKNLDRIVEVNGKKLNTQAQLLAAYLALKNKTEFDVVFVRDGKTITHHYRIVD